ncbi:hypothetical protein O2N63_14110 [Aliiroseovarius sp. KMU-50]|uniref:Uncharacterized protein n=1 Tax=Aliiroseovarius salicola TaxID=3009082 RepID=A0ABT4W3X8_9RHOB|nr:hypothetical protein [Aliiroseovarius sp. KMU-50]MDA5095218.1 hypothetical protein [Aliiroseovarius sp. KMU-50]
MARKLSKDSRMDCPQHGQHRPAFICRHLQHGEGLGFVEAKDYDPDLPFRMA